MYGSMYKHLNFYFKPANVSSLVISQEVLYNELLLLHLKEDQCSSFITVYQQIYTKEG